MFTKTRREYIPVGSAAASLLLTVLLNMSVFSPVRGRRWNMYLVCFLSSVKGGRAPLSAGCVRMDSVTCGPITRPSATLRCSPYELCSGAARTSLVYA